MATTGNRQWAFTEAPRRAGAMAGPYSIYRHKHNPDYIIRTAEAAAPDPHNWKRVATFQPDGALSFNAEMPTDPLAHSRAESIRKYGAN